MSVSEAVLFSWSFPPWVSALNLFAVLLYFRGWLEVRPLLPRRLGGARLAAFLTGAIVLQIALASPIDAFDGFFLSDHMLQHMLLMMVAPPLILLGNPAIPMMRGLPRAVRRFLGRAIKWKPVEMALRVRMHPALCWLAFTAAMIGWHLPKPYDLALRSSGWHEVEHATFLTTSMIFWWPVIQPWPSRAYWPRWSMILYLAFADIVNSVVSALLVFSGRVLYPYYLGMPRLNNFSVANDQVLAGAGMWVIGSVAFIFPAAAIAMQLLSPRRMGAADGPAVRRRGTRASLSLAVFALPVAVLACGAGYGRGVDIDDDVVRAQISSNGLLVTLFAPDGNFARGGTDVAVLVSESASKAPVPDAAVQISSRRVDGEASATMVSAHPEPATNRLLHGAEIDFPSAGMWELEVTVRDGSGNEAALSAAVTVE